MKVFTWRFPLIMANFRVADSRPPSKKALGIKML